MPGRTAAHHAAVLAIATCEVVMSISPTLAAHFTPASEGRGSAVALSVILASGVLVLLVYLGYKKLDRRRQRREGN